MACIPQHSQSRCAVCQLDWLTPPGTIAAEFAGRADLIVAADVVYEPTLVPPLLATICALLHANRGATALLAAERRGVALSTFEAELASLIAAGRIALVADRTEQARAALRADGCPFYCSSDAIERIVLLELRAGDSAGEAPPALAREAPPWRVVARVAACGSATVRTTCRLVGVCD